MNKQVPFSSFVIKIASRCNLDCSYCYEYNMGDDSWKHMPKYMSIEIFEKILYRIKEHSSYHDFSNISISLHGGEPLLVGHSLFTTYQEKIQEILPNHDLSVGIQTNAILIDDEYVKIFEKYDVSIGVSLDGPPKVNDVFRFYHNKKGSGKDVENKLALIQNSDVFGGILCVINIDSDPLDIWHYLASFNPPVIDFLLPHAHWGNTTGEKELAKIEQYGDWLIRIFDDWFNGYKSEIRIRFFEEIIYRLFGQKGSLESLGVEEISLLTIGVNGQYEQVDTMKSVYPGANLTKLNIEEHSLNDVLDHKSIEARQNGLLGLCAKCNNCEIVHVCGGGYYPHRFSTENEFMNPSVYCSALYKLINHMKSVLINNLVKNE
jgi:uncharacterized protein